MRLDEAIKYCEEKAKELRQGLYDAIALGGQNPSKEEIADCEECAKEHEQLAEWMTELKELRKFAQFVTSEVCDDNFKENANSFAEVTCRKLVKLGYVELKNDTYFDVANVKNIDEPKENKKCTDMN